MTEPTPKNSHPCLDWLEQAESYRNQQDLENAIKCYQKAIQANPQNLDVLESLGDFYSEQK